MRTVRHRTLALVLAFALATVISLIGGSAAFGSSEPSPAGGDKVVVKVGWMGEIDN